QALKLAVVPANGADTLRNAGGHPNHPPRVPERARDRLTDPPGRVGRELEALRVVVFLDRTVEPDVAVLDEVDERQAEARIALRDAHDEAQVRPDEAVVRALTLTDELAQVALVVGIASRLESLSRDEPDLDVARQLDLLLCREQGN